MFIEEFSTVIIVFWNYLSSSFQRLLCGQQPVS